ncbi:hypothetical protein LOD99_9209 [Oopsacas minuta]|uniref:Uncharacterized protein n=1 Tax=Oopsacas minuta TaxID=111878 RepID=A0AAV7JDM6_9METZ|nr:hypothetical protein LOD99_9209 [Oopsacas minuta]
MAAKRVEIYQEPDENVPEIARELYLVRAEGGKSLGYRTDIITENMSERVLALLGEQKHQNAHVSKTVLSLKSSCPSYNRGCEWLGTLGECENHLNVCGYVHEKCKLGYEIGLPRHELNIDMKETCLYRKIPCEHCKHDFKVCDISLSSCDRALQTRM